MVKSSNVEFSALSKDGPCGAHVGGEEMFQSSVDSNTTLKWRTPSAVEESVCRISLFKSKLPVHVDINDSSSFTVLKPLDDSADENGTFECNRRADNYESKTISFPAEAACEQCVLQYMWITPNATYYACADIAVHENQTKECPGECVNGGACVDGVCLCVKPYYGEFCEIKSKLVRNQ